MKRTSLWMMALMLGMASMTALVRADEQVTVSAKSTDISEQLDLRTVATLFAESKDLEEFEQKLNNPETAFSNLDLSEREWRKDIGKHHIDSSDHRRMNEIRDFFLFIFH